MTLPFKLPPPPGYLDSPHWDGVNFNIGDHYSPILEYSENSAGWSDDLTTLHEEIIGGNHPIDIASRRHACNQVQQFLPSGTGVIMEIGCSSGYLLQDLVTAFPDATVIGGDVVRDPLFKLAERFPGIPLIRFDLLQCPLPDNIVDVLVMLNVLEHIEDDIPALKKAYNLLKPGGTLIIEVPAGPYLYDSYDRQLNHFRRYSKRELQRKLTNAGFKVIRKSHLGFLLFPAFTFIKLLNKWNPFHNNKVVVRKQATQTAGSVLVRLAMKIESKYLSVFSLPVGIRVLAVAQK